jgi:hypothetical protein
MAGRAGHRGFGFIKRLPSKRFQASYVGPDSARHKAPSTFAAKMDAESWLADEQKRIACGTWTSPGERAQPKAEPTQLTFAEYAATFLATRDLKPKTREHYGQLLANHLAPTFGPMAVAKITTYDVKGWHAAYGTKTPTMRAHAYGLLRTILGEAVHDGVIPANPCHIRGAGSTKRVAAAVGEGAAVVAQIHTMLAE